MIRFLACLVTSVGVAGSAAASIAHDSAVNAIDLRVAGRDATALGYHFDLGEADDERAPRAWQGPIVITQPSGTSCHVRDDVELVERPLVLMRGRFLYVGTYSGSEGRLFAVDIRNCAIAWRSRLISGAAVIRGGSLYLDGVPTPIGADGLPRTRTSLAR